MFGRILFNWNKSGSLDSKFSLRIKYGSPYLSLPLQLVIVLVMTLEAALGYDRIVLRRSRNRIFHYIIPVLSTGTGICQYKSGSGRTGTGFFRIQSGSGKNRILRSDRNSGRNRNLTNAIPARTGIAENVKTDLFVDLRVFL